MLHPNTVLDKISGILPIDLTAHALNVTDRQLLDNLLPVDQGIYLQGNMKALLPSTDTYYTLLNPTKGLTLEEVIESTLDIYTKDGTLVLSKHKLNNIRRFLHIGPTLPVSLINLTSAVAKSFIDERCQYSRNGSSVSPLSFFKHVENRDTLLGTIENSYSPLLDTVYDFIKNDTWHIYFYKNVNSTLIIEKTVDWRVYDWHCIKYQEYVEQRGDG